MLVLSRHVTMDAHERAAVTNRVSQLKSELTNPRLTDSQAASLRRELHMLECRLGGIDEPSRFVTSPVNLTQG